MIYTNKFEHNISLLENVRIDYSIGKRRIELYGIDIGEYSIGQKIDLLYCSTKDDDWDSAKILTKYIVFNDCKVQYLNETSGGSTKMVITYSSSMKISEPAFKKRKRQLTINKLLTE